jgi:hypothetical protein
MLERGASLNIGLIVLHNLGKYLYECPCATLLRACTGVGGQTAWMHGLTARGGGARETLKPRRLTRVEPLMSRAKPHARGGSGLMYL